MSENPFRNVLGTPLEPCNPALSAGFYRTGRCETRDGDPGNHSVCAEMTDEFLRFSASRGNELRAPVPQLAFPGLSAGDRWCLCAARWQEALEAGVAPPVVLEATEDIALEAVRLQDLQAHATAGDATDR
ncbi:MAG: DUF2237 family protein [Pseudomonadota bacterium]